MRAKTPTDLAWAAGFVDGEGHIGINVIRDRRADGGRPQRLSPRIVVGQCVREPLDFLSTLIGGNVRLRSQRTSTHRENWVLEVNGGLQVGAALRALLPYLRVKRGEADRLLELCDRLTSWPQGLRLTPDEIEARNSISAALHREKRGTRRPPRRVPS